MLSLSLSLKRPMRMVRLSAGLESKSEGACSGPSGQSKLAYSNQTSGRMTLLES